MDTVLTKKEFRKRDIPEHLLKYFNFKRANRWILRNKIKWAKQVLIKKENRTIGSVMPTSVKDRFNESGEELYFFVKDKKYYFDLDAVRLKNQVLGVSDFRNENFIRSAELYPTSKYKGVEGQGNVNGAFGKKTLEARLDDTKEKNTKNSRSYNMKKLLSEVRLGIKPNTGIERNAHLGMKSAPQPNEQNAFNEAGKNLPTIWQIGSEPHNFQRELGVDTDHFAIFPEALVEIPIKCGCPERVCKKCGKISERISEIDYIPKNELPKDDPRYRPNNNPPVKKLDKMVKKGTEHYKYNQAKAFYKTKGWTDCGCNAGFEGGIVMDIFGGSGTVGVVAKRLKRNYILIELNPKYIEIAEKRIRATGSPLL